MYTTYNKSSDKISQPPNAKLAYSYSIRKNALYYGPPPERKNKRQNTYRRNCIACVYKGLEIDRNKRDYQRLQNTVAKRLTSNERKVKNLTSGIIKELEEKNSSLRARLQEVEYDRDRLNDTLWELELNPAKREKTAQDQVENLQDGYDKALGFISELEYQLERKEEEVRNLRWKMKDMEEKNEDIKEQVRWKEDNIEKLERTLYQEQRNSDRFRITCQKKAEEIDYMQKSLDRKVEDVEHFKHELDSVKSGVVYADVRNKEKEIAQLQRNLHSTVEEYWRKDNECKEVENEKRNLIEKLRNLESQIEAEKRKNQNLENNNPSRKSEDVIARLQNQLHTVEVNYNLLQQENRNLQIKLGRLEPPLMKGTYQLASTTERENMLHQNEKLRNQNKKLEEKVQAMLQEKADLALMHSVTVQQKHEEILVTKEKLEKVEIEIEPLKSKLKDSEQRLRALQMTPVSEKQKLSEEKESLEKEKSALQQKIDECFQSLTDAEGKNREIEAMEKIIQQLKIENKRLKAEVSTTKTEDTRSSHEETMEAQLRKQKTENQTFREYISMLQKEKDSGKAKCEQTQEENRRLHENLNQLCDENRKLQDANAGEINKILGETQQQLHSLRTETQRLEKRIAELVKENSQLRVHISEVSKEKNDTLTRKAEVEQKLMKENQNLQENLDQLRAEKRQLQEENVASTSKKLTETDQQITSLTRMVRQLEEKVTQLSSENNQLHMDIAEVSKEKDNALTRLSKVAGAKLTHGNAAITDLSDTNRPTKLAEKFSELYDNQWTDAFEELDNTYNNEEDTIQALLKILQDAYTYCVQIENDYETRIRQAVFTLLDGNTKETRQITGADIPVQKALADLRLSLGNTSCMVIEEMFLAKLPAILKKVDVSVSPKTKLYARQCASLCWRMRIRDPPVFVRFEFRKGTTFNTDILRRYTKTGGYLDFIVWPALYLHENGPVLSKGVAQPKHSP